MCYKPVTVYLSGYLSHKIPPSFIDNGKSYLKYFAIFIWETDKFIEVK